MNYKNYALMHQSTSLKIELHRQWLNGRLIINLFIFSTMPSKWGKTFFAISDSDLYQLRPARTDGMKYLTPASQKLYEKIYDKLIDLDSVYLRSSQNSQPNSDASDMNSGKERGRVFRIACSDPSPAF